MARPKFVVQHFMACLGVSWEGLPGPKTARTLEGVIHCFGVPPGAEAPFVYPEVWLYARMFLTNQLEGARSFSVRLMWCDAAGGPQEVFTRSLAPVRFSNAEPVANAAWALRPVSFPGLGLYEFLLLAKQRNWSGPYERILAREFIRIEHQP